MIDFTTDPGSIRPIQMSNAGGVNNYWRYKVKVTVTNAGNAIVNSLYFSKAPLVFGANSIPVGSITFETLPAMPLSLDVGDSVVATVTVTIGKVQGAFTYFGIQRMFEDADIDSIWDAAEFSDTFELVISIGDKVIYENNPANSAVAFGNRNVSATYNQAVTVYAGSAVPLNRVKWKVLGAFKGIDYTFPVASLTFTPATAQYIDGLNNRVFQAVAEVGFVSAGLYVATASFYDDDNDDGVVDVGEASCSFNLSMTVNPVYAIDLVPTEVNFGQIAQGASVNKEIMFQNSGNIQLNNFSWTFSALDKAPDQILLANLTHSLSFTPDPVLMWEYATSTVTLSVDAAQPPGVYGPSGPQTIQTTDGTAPTDWANFTCEIVTTGAPTFQLASGSLSQEIATLSFSATAPDNRYFMSAWICPGTGSANISFVTYNEFGEAVGTVSEQIDSAGNLTSSGAPMAVAGSGILDKVPYEHPDHPGEDFYYYRVFVAFDYTFSQVTASNTRIILGNTSSPDAPKNRVWFDGVQLERRRDRSQARPSAFHSIRTICSPTSKQTLTGEDHHNEW